MDTLLQFIATFVGAALFFMWGAHSKGIAITMKSAWEIIQAAAAIVLIFAFLSGGRGCTSSGITDTDCRPAGPGIYNDC